MGSAADVAKPATGSVADIRIRLGVVDRVAGGDPDRSAVLHRLRAAIRSRDTERRRWLKLPSFAWPSRPSWLYRLTQGLHVGVGLVLIPVVLAKLWSVMPRFFAWPPLRSVAQLVERLSLAMLVGGIIFELATGVLNIQYDYIFGFSFYTAHYFGAWVFIAGFTIHVLIKLPKMLSGLRSHSFFAVLRGSPADTRPEPLDRDGLVATHPHRRRSAAAGAGAGRRAARCSSRFSPRDKRWAVSPVPPRYSCRGAAAAETARTTFRSTGLRPPPPLPRLTPGADGGSPCAARRPIGLTRGALEKMPQHTAELPIACVEGWSTTQRWTGVRLRFGRAGTHAHVRRAVVHSLERAGGSIAPRCRAIRWPIRIRFSPCR